MLAHYFKEVPTFPRALEEARQCVGESVPFRLPDTWRASSKGRGKVRYKDLELQILYNEKEIDSWICNSLSCAVLSPAGLLISFNGESPYQTCDSPIKEDRETSVRECI